MGICCMSQETQTGVPHQPRRVGWGRGWVQGPKKEGIYVYISLTRFAVQQKVTQRCRAIIRQLKNKVRCTNTGLCWPTLHTSRRNSVPGADPQQTARGRISRTHRGQAALVYIREGQEFEPNSLLINSLTHSSKEDEKKPTPPLS